MRIHISLNVKNISLSVDFYQKIFGLKPQKQTEHYAKFDLLEPALNLSMQSSEDKDQEISRVNHFGIEVYSPHEINIWNQRLQERGISTTQEINTHCCFARQDKIWFQDPDDNKWEIFHVYEQLPLKKQQSASGKCCG
jgi:catechol 2,3-dioxygenase-like lactoylglutathione lyase family enzyme